MRETRPRRTWASRLAIAACALIALLFAFLSAVSFALMIGWQGKTISVAIAYGRLRVWRWSPNYPSGLIADGASATMAGWFMPQVVVLPIWLFALLFLALTIYLVRRLRPRFPAGCCAKCGYDLTGNVSGVCPECGTSVARRNGESRNPKPET